jgi:hypothetical protein
MFSYGDMAAMAQELPYRVELWDDSDTHVEDLALVGDHAVARAAFAEAVRRRPARSIILRQSRGCLPTAEGKDTTHAQNPERGSYNHTKETPRNSKGISRCVCRAGKASANSGSLSGGRNGAAAWRHSGHLHQV